MMNGVHTFSTKPFFVRNHGKKFSMSRIDLLVLKLSALFWKKYNGNVFLYTDKKGFEFFEKNKMIYLWDKININILENMPSFLDHKTFWAASKIFAIANQNTPFVSVDTDLFVRRNLGNYINGDLSVLHLEKLNPRTYPNPKVFGYKKPDFKLNLLPANAALTYFGNSDFKKEYTNQALKFINYQSQNRTKIINNELVKMVFAEQSLLSQAALQTNTKYKLLIKDIFTGEKWDTNKKGESNIAEVSKYLWHTWGEKTILRTNPQREKQVYKYLTKILNKI